jgi:hypothetical protein
MTMNEQERQARQEKLANLFFEMGMDLDLVEKMSGIDKKVFLRKKIEKSKGNSLTLNNYDSSMYLENRNSY